MPKNGDSLATVSKEAMDWAYSEVRVEHGVEVVLGPESGTVPYLGVTRPDDLDFMMPKLTPHPWKCFSEPLRLTNEDGIKKLRRAIVNCTPTLAMRPPERREEAFAGDRVFEIDSGHDLMITEPQQTADALLSLAEDAAD